MRKIPVLALLFFISFSVLFSQSYQMERFWVGPTLGLGFGNLGFGANGEYGMTENIGLGIDLGYSSFTEDFNGALSSDTYFKYSLLGILVAGSYHFMPNKQFDPYLKLGIGYFNWDFAYYQEGKEVKMPFGTSAAYSSGVGFTGQIGARYHFNELISARASLGYPFLLSAGVDFSFGNTQPSVRKQAEPKYEPPVETTKPATTERIEEKESKPDVKPETKEVEKPKDNSYPIYIGAYYNVRGTINTEVAEGRSIKYTTNFPSLGASILLPFSKTSSMGLQVDFGYEAHGFVTMPYESKDVTDATKIREHYHYLYLSPSLNLSGFMIGINFGFPQSAKAENYNGDLVDIIDSRGVDNPFGVNTDITDYMTTLMEVKIGGSIKLFDEDFGRLNLNIMASYAFSGIYENVAAYKYAYEADGSTIEPKDNLNPKPASLSIGISYYYKVGL